MKNLLIACVLLNLFQLTHCSRTCEQKQKNPALKQTFKLEYAKAKICLKTPFKRNEYIKLTLDYKTQRVSATVTQIFKDGSRSNPEPCDPPPNLVARFVAIKKYLEFTGQAKSSSVYIFQEQKNEKK